ncbi:MAG: hypothetical protein MUF27_12035 [Acidobacteria bacterium]|nr:hypothetical protein [Acidobacteriota bacterium]
MDRAMRRTLARLAGLGGLLLLFPVAALVLRSAGPPPPRANGFALTGTLRSGAGPEGSTQFVIGLQLESRAAGGWRVDQVFLTLLDGERPVSTLIEDAPALEARQHGPVEIAPGGRCALGPFVVEVPAGARGDVLLASVRLSDAESGRSATAQAELPAEPAR